MYGTMARFQITPGQEQRFEERIQRWMQERAPKVDGFITDYVLTPDARPGERLILGVFDSKEHYVASGKDPEQDRWYREVRSLLTADPEWTDGEIAELTPATASR